MDRIRNRQALAGLRDQIRKSDVQGWADRYLHELFGASSS